LHDCCGATGLQIAAHAPELLPPELQGKDVGIFIRHPSSRGGPGSTPPESPLSARFGIDAEQQFVAACVVFMVVLCKFAVLMLDPHVRLFMGDSATYLFSAVVHTTPPDRSFIYPTLIDQSAGRSGSLMSLLLMQTVFGAITALTLYFVLRSAFGVRLWLAALAACVLALEPSQLFYERMIMTETTSGLCLLVCVAAALNYLRTGALRWLLVCAGLGTLLASLRVGMVPLALCLAPLGPLLLALLRGRNHVPVLGLRRLSAHFLVALLATFLCHHEYKAWYGERTNGPPSYLQYAGIFRLGLVVPLLKPEHFAGTGVSAEILHEVGYSLADPHQREAHIWQPTGLIGVLRSHAGLRTREIASILADRAIADDPLGLVRMGISTFAEYFDAQRLKERLSSDLGFDEGLNQKTLTLLRERFNYDATNMVRTPVTRYFERTSVWLVFCLFALLPLALLMLRMQWRTQPAPALLVTLLAIGLVLGELLCAQIISFRYLHPLPMLFALCAAALIDRLLAMRAPARAVEMAEEPQRLAAAA
jgi:hypothetical protein